MRRPVQILLILLLGLAGPAVLWGQYNWTGPFPVSSGNAVDFVIDSKTGNLHVVSGYEQSGLIYTMLDSVGNKLHEEVVVAGAPEGNLHWGPSIDLDSQGRVHIVYKSRMGKLNIQRPSEPYYDLAYIRQTTGGWSSPLVLSQKVWRGYIVRMAIDSGDRVHVAQSSINAALEYRYGGPYGNITYFRVVNGILEQSTMLTPTDQSVYRIDSRFELGVAPDDRIHLVYGNPDYHQEAPQITYIRSSDHGDHWTQVEDLKVAQSPLRNGSPDMFIDKAGHIHMVYGTLNDASVMNGPSIRYVQYQSNFKKANFIATGVDAIDEGWGVGTVGSTSGGEYIGVAYLSHWGYGELFATLSENNGQTWSAPAILAFTTASSSDVCRNTPVLRGNRNHLYLIYPVGNRSYLYYLRNLGDEPPTAVPGGPYAGVEGTPIPFNMSGSQDSGLNAGIASYDWDWTNDGVVDTTVTTPTFQYAFSDDFNSRAALTVHDNAGQTHKALVLLEVTNAPPTVQILGPRHVYEMDTLRLEAQVSDPGSADTHTLQWDLGEEGTEDGLSTKILYEDDGHWVIQITVEDDDGATATDTAQITIMNRAPQAHAGGPYRTAPMETLVVTGYGSDPSPQDEISAQWDLDGNGIFETEGFSTSLSFSAEGEYQIVFQVRDDDGGFARDTAQVVVGNEAPEIDDIPDQSILEGEAFTSVALDDYVTDREQSADRLSWTVSGQQALTVDLGLDRVLTVAAPDSEWAGEETLRLVVADPLGLKDTTWVSFTVTGINDAPRWTDGLATVLNEDDSLKVSFDQLRALVFDPDHDFESLAFSLFNGIHVHGEMDAPNNRWLFWPDANWYGSESVEWVVTDPEGAEARLPLHFTVQGMPDAPSAFRVLTPLSIDSTAWPDSLRFRWAQASDPDSNDMVLYSLHISSQGGEGTWSYTSPTIGDTTWLVKPLSGVDKGLYFWWVEARDLGGHAQESTNNGTLFIRDLNSPVEEVAKHPDAFRLLQNHPNPFSTETQITFHLPRPARVHVSVYNLLGQMIKVLANEERDAGAHNLFWNGRDEWGYLVPSGVYLCRFTTEGQAFMCKMMFMQ